MYQDIDVPSTVRAVLAELQRRPAWQFLQLLMAEQERKAQYVDRQRHANTIRDMQGLPQLPIDSGERGDPCGTVGDAFGGRPPQQYARGSQHHAARGTAIHGALTGVW